MRIDFSRKGYYFRYQADSNRRGNTDIQFPYTPRLAHKDTGSLPTKELDSSSERLYLY